MSSTSDLAPAVRHTELLDQLASNGVLKDTGLYLHKTDLTYDQYEAVGAMLAKMRSSLQFAIGDWLLLGEAQFPEKFSQAVEVLKMSPEGVRDYIRVARQVPRSVRSPKVEWSLHRPLASLKVVDAKTGEVHPDIKAQKAWLKRIEEEGLSHHQIREEMRNGAPPDSPNMCRCCKRPW